MKFPSIGGYINSFLSADDCFKTLQQVSLQINLDNEPTYQSGGFGVVFKVYTSAGVRAIKCFTKQQIGRVEAYRKISGGLVRSQYLIDYEFLNNEIFVASYGQLNYYPVLNMEWVDGATLGKVVQKACNDGNNAALEQLSAAFDDMALWILHQDFAHGDIKPDNIIVTPGGGLMLVDYDGIYMPSMKGEMQREFGTVGFQHPLRAAADFNKSIDDYSIALLSFTLRALAVEPMFYEKFAGKDEGLLFSPAKAVAGDSAFVNFITTTPLADLLLFDCIKSPTPAIANISDAIAQRRYFEKIELQQDIKPVAIGNKFGYADPAGNLCISPIYDKVEDFAYNSAAVCVKGKWGYINKMGQAMCRFKFDNAWSFKPCGLALVQYKGKYGFVGTDCKMKIAAKFDYLTPFSENTAVAAQNGKYGYINSRGQWVVKPQYDYAENFRTGVATVELDGKKITIFR